jgi:hypothetical protein
MAAFAYLEVLNYQILQLEVKEKKVEYAAGNSLQLIRP